MSRIRLAFYKAKFPDGSIVDDLIALWTWLPNWGTPRYSHVEIGFLIEDKWKYFSSTMRSKAKGTRWISEEKLLKNRERWDVYKVNRYICFEKILERAKELENKKYDLLGIFGFIIFGLNNNNKWYCSETCWKVLTSNWKKRISPRRMYNKTKDLCNLELVKKEKV